jgi:hypothetical protein
MRFARLLAAYAAILLASHAPAGASLVIIPTYDPNITGDPNATAIKGVIQSAINTYEANFSDNITVNITFQEMSGGLGQSNTFFSSESYTSFLTQITADTKTADDITAVAHLPTLAEFTSTFGTTNINVKTANARAIGFNVVVPSDGTVSLNTNATFPGSSGTSGTYSLLAVTEHEIDEVLGMGSELCAPIGPNCSAPTNPFPEDLFRYSSSPNVRSYTTSTATAFFSIDGTTQLAEFNNTSNGADFGDWRSNPLPAGVQPKVQDAFATAGATPSLGVEFRVLDVLGYDSVVPEPSTVFLFASALAALGLAKWRMGRRTNA